MRRSKESSVSVGWFDDPESPAQSRNLSPTGNGIMERSNRREALKNEQVASRKLHDGWIVQEANACGKDLCKNNLNF
ncbi:hypothetical protein FACS189472_18010 [Alphaproteobacteria bacterium]|nr:hypothetical protein FACS189472_18010 [Alphaproteobacteria bacterium]